MGAISSSQSSLILELPAVIIGDMTWDEYQDLSLKVAREIAEERGFRVEIAEPEDHHEAAFDFKPMMARRWGFFRRRPQLREITLTFYPREIQILPYFKMGWWVDINELDKLDTFTFRPEFEKRIGDQIEEFERWNRNS